MEHTASKTHITGLITVGVPVADQERALDFYVSTLGFKTRRDVPFGPMRWIEVGPHSAAVSIALVTTPTASRVGVDTGIRLASTDADADHAALLAAGVDADPEVIRMGGSVPPMFTFRDADGNQLVVVQQP
jgi:catechol 2,3-dioxygenase-like lactoylglutathione lyase family enzyme